MDFVARLRLLATDKWHRRWVIVVSVVLVVLIGSALSRLVWLVVEGPPVVPLGATGMAMSAPVATATVPAAPASTPEMARNWRLFGDAAAPAVQGGEQAPDTSLALQLLGIFSTGDDRLAGAVIAERGKEGDLFRIGTAVPGGATLEKVEADRVLLRRRGQLETLRFDAAPAEGAGAQANAVAELPKEGLDISGGFRGLRDRLMQQADPGGGADAAAGNRATVENLMADLKGNPDKVLGDLGLKAAGGGGYAVGEGPSSDAMRSIGLRPGDVVLSVNGKPLGHIQNDARMIDEVKASGEARVEIRRGSQTFTVNYPL